MFEPIEIPRGLRRKRARYQLAVLSALAAVVLVATTLGAMPAASDSMAAALRDEMAGPRAKASAVQAYVRGDYAAAQRALLAAAGQGDAEAQELLGVLYAAGHPGVPADPAAASMWLDRAAQNGRPSARELKCALFRHTENPGAHRPCVRGG